MFEWWSWLCLNNLVIFSCVWTSFYWVMFEWWYWLCLNNLVIFSYVWTVFYWVMFDWRCFLCLNNLVIFSCVLTAFYWDMFEWRRCTLLVTQSRGIGASFRLTVFRFWWLYWLCLNNSDLVDFGCCISKTLMAMMPLAVCE